MNKKISELNSLAEIKDGDMFVTVDSSEPLETKKVLGSVFKDYLGLDYIEGSLYNDSSDVFANGRPGGEDPSETVRDGWYYQNTVAGQKINWYFFDATSPMGSSVSLGDFGAYAVVSFDSLASGPIMSVYTVPTGSGDVHPGFAHSKVAYSSSLSGKVLGKKYLVYFGKNPSVYPELERIQLSKSESSSGGDQNPSETVLTVSYGSDSGAAVNEVKMMVEALGVNSAGYKTRISLKIRAANKESLDSLEDRLDAVEGKVVDSYDEVGEFPSQGVQSILYLSKSSNKLYRWDGDEYVEMALVDLTTVQDPAGLMWEGHQMFDSAAGEWDFGIIDNTFQGTVREVSWENPGSLQSIASYSVDYSPDSGFTWFNLAVVEPSESASADKMSIYVPIAKRGAFGSEASAIPNNINNFPCVPNYGESPYCAYFNVESLGQLNDYYWFLGYARSSGNRKLEFRVKASNVFGVSSGYSYTNEGEVSYSEISPPTGVGYTGSPNIAGHYITFNPSVDSVNIFYEVQFKWKYPLIRDDSTHPAEWTDINSVASSPNPQRKAQLLYSGVGPVYGTKWFESTYETGYPTEFWNFRVRAIDPIKNIVSDWGYRYEEILGFPNLAAFPSIGDAYPIYIAEDTGKSYKWNALSSSYDEMTTVEPPLGISDIENLSDELDNKLSVDSVIDGGGY